MPIAPSSGVLRAGELLNCMTARPMHAFSVSELARQLDIPRATCDSLLLALSASGFVRRMSDRRYRLGTTCIVLGEAARAANPGLRVAERAAEQLAKAEKAVVGVTVRDGRKTRVAGVFDHGAPFGIRPRAGDAIALVPPFGASFVAWDDAAGRQAWLDRAQPALTRAEQQRYAVALHAVRVRGYSVTVSPRPGDELAAALEQLLDAEPSAGSSRRNRDAAIRTVTHSDYLAAELEPPSRTRLTQISAPVFGPDGEIVASLMVLGPGHEVTSAYVAALGEAVASAAARAGQELAGTTPSRAPSLRSVGG